MPLASDTDRLVVLDRATCHALLGSGHIGRIAFNTEPSPEVLPVNYAIHDDTIIFRTGAGLKQAAAERRAPATFEVDGVDAVRGSGWSVVVRGRLEPFEGHRPTLDTPQPLPGGQREYTVLLRINEITGRRIPPEQGWVLPGRTWRGVDASDLMG